jgi:hypothetical protein
VLAGQRRETLRIGAGSGFAGQARSHRLGVPRRLAVPLFALGCVLPLLAPSRSLACSLVVRGTPCVGSLRPNHARHDQVLPYFTAAAPSRADVPSTTDGASLTILVVLAINSTAMVIRLVSSPPSWMKG